MKIVQVSESVSSLAGGLQYSVRQLCLALNRQGHEALILTGRDEGAHDDLKVPIKFLARRFGPRLTILDGLKDRILFERPDVVFQHGVWPPFCLQITKACDELNIPYVIHPHGMLDPFIVSNNSFAKKLVLYAYQRENLRRAAAFRALNANESAHIKKIVPDARVFVAPNGISIRPEDCDEFTDGRPGNSVLFLGRIDKKKGVLELIQSWKKIAAMGKLPLNAQLCVAGWGTDERYLAQVKAEISSCPQAMLQGPAFGEDKISLYRRFSAFILPSKGEGLPTTVLEAWAMGCVVLCSRECNFSVEQMSRAAIDCGQSVDSVSNALLMLFDMSIEQRLMLCRGGSSEVFGYDWDAIANNMIKELESLM